MSMCGIAGFSGAFSPEILPVMNASIAHRGPDDAGTKLITEYGNTIGLAHRRLSIIDLSAEGHQPMTVHCSCCSAQQGQLWLSYNGEIYNYRELRSELERSGHTFHSKTDTEVLLHLYAQYGFEMLSRLNGIFAFALYDGRKQPGALLLARDGLGVKPLYYARTNQGVIFASEIKAIIASKAVAKELDLTALHYYIAYLWSPGENTPLTAVKKLLPGEAMMIRKGETCQRWFFYNVPYDGTYRDLPLNVMCKQLDKHLKDAVARQLIADVPVGAFLSGGLDSSAIVAYMRQLNPEMPVNCYSIGFKEGMDSEGNPDDIPYARAVAGHLGVNINVIEVQADIINQLQHMIYHLDEPQGDPAPLHVYLIANAARADGIKVLLSGAGGDDIFSGYRRHRALQLDRFWSFVPKPLRRQMANYATAILEGKSGSYNMQQPWARRLAKLMAPVDLAGDRRLVNYFLWSTESLRRTLYSPGMAEQVENVDTALPLLQSLARIPDERENLNRMLYLETRHFLADHNLNYTDKMAMAAGVEVRVPLLDKDLVAAAARIPVRYKQRGATGKAIFKKTMEAYLPYRVIYRPKAGFGAPLRRWLHQELAPLVSDILSPAAIAQRGIFDPNAVKQLITNDKAGRIDAAYTIFSLLCIEMWCRTFL